MHRDGASKRNIARPLKMSKNTVKDYLHKLMTIGGKVDELLKLDDPVLERQFHGGNPAYSDDRHQKLMEQMDYYSQELNGSKGGYPPIALGGIQGEYDSALQLQSVLLSFTAAYSCEKAFNGIEP